jgi:hypothetical protein
MPAAMTSRPNNPEARAWLLSNYNPSALATNRFQTTTRAFAFVCELYAAGAEVLIDNIMSGGSDDSASLAPGENSTH